MASKKSTVPVVILLVALGMPMVLVACPFGIFVRSSVQPISTQREYATLRSCPSKQVAEAILKEHPWLTQNWELEGLTPLQAAAQCGRADLVALYLSSGFEFRTLDMPVQPNQPFAGETALHFAIRGKNEQCIRLLLTAGANVNERSAAGQTPIELAESLGMKEFAVIMRQPRR